MKWMRYKFEPGIIDPDNPLKQGNIIQELKENERKPKKRSKKVASIDIVTGGVQEIAAKDGQFFCMTEKSLLITKMIIEA